MRILNMKLFRSTTLLAFSAVVYLLAYGGGSVMAQGTSGVKVGVVDMQEVLNGYYKTKIEIKKLNALIDRRQDKIKELAAEQKERIKKLGELKKKLDDTAVAKSAKKEVVKEFEKLAKVVAVRGQEIRYRQRKASVEIATARSEMESILLAEIKKEMKAVIAANGVDLVFDKSFLPKASKSIIYTSGRVNDLSQKIVASLNAMAPATVPAP